MGGSKTERETLSPRVQTTYRKSRTLESSRVRSTVPQQGQTGYHQRTEYNKRLVSIGNADEASVSGGFIGYGEVNGPHILVHGSLPGPQKRLLRFRPAIRPNRLNSPIEIHHISKASNQG